MLELPNDFIEKLTKAISEAFKSGSIAGFDQALSYESTEIEKATKERIKKQERDKLAAMLDSYDRADEYLKLQEQKRQEKKLLNEIQIIGQVAIAENKNIQKANKAKIDAEAKLKKALQDGDSKAARKAQKEIRTADNKEKKEIAKIQGSELSGGEKQLIKSIETMSKNICEGLNKINNAISSYAKYQTSINTRLQGTSSFAEATDRLSSVAFSPLVKAEDLYANLNTLVGEGIATNVEQRAFFMTVKDGIATTFDVNNASLKRIIRIQQDDSTAARLGMESYLTKFLNEFVESTEYLTSTFDTVAESLLEASSLLSTKESTEFEYIVQKWLGTLTGVGLSESSATAIASAIGKLGSGDTSLFSEGVGSLLTLGATRGGVDLTSALFNGLGAVDTNNLLYGITSVLQEYGSASSNVVKSQLASTFGVKVSDLVSAQNLTSQDMEGLYQSMMTYNDMYTELGNQFNTLTQRMGTGNILENLFSNFTYQTGMNIASNPALYGLWKVTDLIQSVTGGIDIPAISVMGNSVDLNTTVENLMKTALVGVSTIGAIGDIVNGLSSLGDTGAYLNTILGLSGGTSVQRGQGLTDYTIGTNGMKRRNAGTTVSASSYVGNGSGEDYNNSALNEANDNAQEKVNNELNNENNKSDILKYLEGDDFVGKFNQIATDIGYLKDTGIKVTEIPTDSIRDGIAGFFNKDSGKEGGN